MSSEEARSWGLGLICEKERSSRKWGNLSNDELSGSIVPSRTEDW